MASTTPFDDLLNTLRLAVMRIAPRRTITGGSMRTRWHRSYGHGLAPGTASDLGCPSCQREDAADAVLARMRARCARDRYYTLTDGGDWPEDH